MTKKKEEKTAHHYLHIKVSHEEFKHFEEMANKEERSIHFISRKALLKGSNFKPKQ